MRILAFAAFVMLTVSCGAQSFDDMRLVILGGKSNTNWHGQADLQGLQFELGRSMSPQATIALTGGIANVWQPRSWFGDQHGGGNESVRALTAAVRFRYTPRPSSIVRPYLEVATGPMIAERRVPASTSHFNFMSDVGAGLLLNAQGRNPVFAGYRFMHISNGGFSPRNSGWNVSAVVVGAQLRIDTPRPR